MIDKGDTFTITQLENALEALGIIDDGTIEEIRIHTHAMRITRLDQNGDKIKTHYRLIMG